MHLFNTIQQLRNKNAQVLRKNPEKKCNLRHRRASSRSKLLKYTISSTEFVRSSSANHCLHWGSKGNENFLCADLTFKIFHYYC